MLRFQVPSERTQRPLVSANYGGSDFWLTAYLSCHHGVVVNPSAAHILLLGRR
jgi:hypothetical protein